MKLIDMHCDTLGKLLYGEMTQGMNKTERIFARATAAERTLMDEKLSVNLPGMRKAETLAQFFACFTCLPLAEGGYEECYGDALEMIELLKRQCEIFSDQIAMAYSANDLRANESAGKISAFLTIEEGGIVNNKMERLEELYVKGVRLITPIWNFENCFGSPNSKDPKVMQQGLTEFGKEALAYASELGMILDVSHASDGSFNDMLQVANGPIVASHSNCRVLCEHPRNLTDEMIRALAERGGAAGVNFYGVFLDGSDRSELNAMVAHVLHMIRVGGEDFPAIGTDFDGFDGMTYEAIPNVSDMERLRDALCAAGVSERQLDKIWNKNIMRLLP